MDRRSIRDTVNAFFQGRESKLTPWKTAQSPSMLETKYTRKKGSKQIRWMTAKYFKINSSTKEQEEDFDEFLFSNFEQEDENPLPLKMVMKARSAKSTSKSPIKQR